jgi:DNA-binding transcriptional ArsR family regulator
MPWFDPLALDRELRHAAERWRSWRRRARDAVHTESWEALEDDPFLRVREATTRSRYQQISELHPSDPLRQPLLRWTYRLAEERINREASLCVLRARCEPHLLFERPLEGRFSYRAVLERLLTDRARRRAWLSELPRHTEPIAELEARLWERRAEIAQGFGVNADELELPNADIASVARAWLASTDEAFRSLGAPEIADVFERALAFGAGDGWPAKLTPRTLQELLRETGWLDRTHVDPGRLPALWAPASFVRALRRVGTALADALAPRHQPFAIAHEPYGLERFTLGAFVGSLPLNARFARRALGLSGDALDRHLRALRAAYLVDSRIAALKVLLRGPALAGPKAFAAAFEEETAVALGQDLPRSLAGVLFKLSVTDAPRFAGLLRSGGRISAYRQRHDEDWYRNPRATQDFLGHAELSPEPSVAREELDEGAAKLRELLFESLG